MKPTAHMLMAFDHLREATARRKCHPRLHAYGYMKAIVNTATGVGCLSTRVAEPVVVVVVVVVVAAAAVAAATAAEHP
jgi:hypothetical protein